MQDKQGEIMKLAEYPDKDLFEDGELDNDSSYSGGQLWVSEVEKKIILLWRQGKIVIAKKEKQNG